MSGLEFVGFERGKDGSSRGVAVFYDPLSFNENGRVAFDRKNLELRIANLKQQAPHYNLSSEMAVLTAMKEGGA